jgi:hypothetical protein
VRLARVFPSKTTATPTDELAFYGPPSMMFPPEVDKVHISTVFTWDINKAEMLAEQWKQIAPVDIGGPAYGKPSYDFVSGRYLRPGYVMTSRGCNNKCWFCKVWKRQPELIELPINDGRIIQDDNLLACSEKHIREVFEMLERQPHKPEFTGGIEAALLKPWHVDLFLKVKPKQIFFAYDEERDYEPLREASKLLRDSGLLRSHIVRAYVLIDYPSDTKEDATTRLRKVMELGIMPFAMLYRDDNGAVRGDWRKFQRLWANPTILGSKMKEYRQQFM